MASASPMVEAAEREGLITVMPDGAGMAGAMTRAEQIIAEMPEAWMPKQFDNPANPAIHAATTAEEIRPDQ